MNQKPETYFNNLSDENLVRHLALLGGVYQVGGGFDAIVDMVQEIHRRNRVVTPSVLIQYVSARLTTRTVSTPVTEADALAYSTAADLAATIPADVLEYDHLVAFCWDMPDELRGLLRIPLVATWLVLAYSRGAANQARDDRNRVPGD